MKRATKLVLALAALAAGGILALGAPPLPDDKPGIEAAGETPGDGGLRRPFPRPAAPPGGTATPERIELGRLLFFDAILSGANDQSCATCHHPDLGFSDGRRTSMGRDGRGIGPEREGGTAIRRAAPTLWNAAWSARLFWDGRAESLEHQAGFPITSADEMDQRPEQLEAELRAIPEYVAAFEAAFPGEPGPAVSFDNVRRAIAAFERTLVSDRSRFDRYAAGEPEALSPAERRGLTLFRSLKTRCFECHGFPTFANADFKVIAVPPAPGAPPDAGRGEVAGAAHAHAFKVPTLRNVALSAPYMHNGRFATLEEVLDFYAQGGGPGMGFRPAAVDDKIRAFRLEPQEKADLVAFLHALTDESRLPERPERVPSGLPVVPAIPRRGALLAAASAEAVPAPGSAGRPARRPGFASAGPPGPAVLRVTAGGSIQAAVDRAREGDTIEVEPGSYPETVLVDRDGLTLRGLARNGSRAVLDGGGRLSDAVIASGHRFRIEGFAVRRYTGNGITVHGATGAAFKDLEVEDTGLYGVYPVQCRDVLVEGVTVTGARDAGIYVGQSAGIVVRGNQARRNVTGIEIENSVDALVEGNLVEDNTGGILVFLLPNNPSKVGRSTRVLGNRVVANNRPNFGDPNAIVAKVPAGSGIFVMAADETEVAGNEIRDNDSFGVAVVSLRLAFPRGARFDVGSEPDGNKVHGNRYARNGRNPAPSVRALGAVGRDLVWDGSGAGNLWDEPGAARFPPLLPGPAWPGVAQRAWARLVGFARDRL